MAGGRHHPRALLNARLARCRDRPALPTTPRPVKRTVCATWAAALFNKSCRACASLLYALPARDGLRHSGLGAPLLACAGSVHARPCIGSGPEGVRGSVPGRMPSRKAKYQNVKSLRRRHRAHTGQLSNWQQHRTLLSCPPPCGSCPPLCPAAKHDHDHDRHLQLHQASTVPRGRFGPGDRCPRPGGKRAAVQLRGKFQPHPCATF